MEIIGVSHREMYMYVIIYKPKQQNTVIIHTIIDKSKESF